MLIPYRSKYSCRDESGRKVHVLGRTLARKIVPISGRVRTVKVLQEYETEDGRSVVPDAGAAFRVESTGELLTHSL